MIPLWLDGALIDPGHGLPLLGHAAQRGSLVFDVGSFHPTERGPALFRAREHVVRFLASAASVGLEFRFDEKTLVEGAVEVVRASGLAEGIIRWSAFLETNEPDLLPTSYVAHAAIAVIPSKPARTTPLAIAVFDDARKASPDVLPPATKAAGAYLGPMLARRRAAKQGADDVVLLDREGFIAEAPVSNAFAVVGGTLWTPPLTYVLPGITRDSVLALARAAGIPVREEPLPREIFENADEAFLTSTTSLVAPIGSINGKALPAPGPVSARLGASLLAVHRGEEPSDWLRWIRD